MVLACMVGATQKFRAKAQAAANREILEFTFALPLCIPVSNASEPMRRSRSKKLVVKRL
jgi:hypothetical protein